MNGKPPGWQGLVAASTEARCLAALGPPCELRMPSRLGTITSRMVIPLSVQAEDSSFRGLMKSAELAEVKNILPVVFRRS